MTEDPFAEEQFGDDQGKDVQPLAPDADAEALIRHAIDTVSAARAMPLSSSVLVARDELIDLLQGALERLPEEMREARWLLRERDEFLDARRREADNLLDEVRVQAERMVQRTEIVRQANQVAQRIIEDAREESRRLRHEAEDFCDQKLASFEIVLDRTMKIVQSGREKLQATPPPTESVTSADDTGEAKDAELSGFFDQDDA